MSGKLDFAKKNDSKKTDDGAGEDLDDMTEAALSFFRAAVDPSTSLIYSWWLTPLAHVYVAWALFGDYVLNLQSVDRSRKAISSHYDRCTKVYCALISILI